MNRGLSIIYESEVSNTLCEKNKFAQEKKNIQEKIYDTDCCDKVELLKRHHIYLSRVDLENDLYEAIPANMDRFVSQKNTTKSAVDYLQDKKMIYMIELCNELNATVTINKIYNHPRFVCLKELVRLCNQ